MRAPPARIAAVIALALAAATLRAQPADPAAPVSPIAVDSSALQAPSVAPVAPAESLDNARAALVALEARNSELEVSNRELGDKLRALETANKDLDASVARLQRRVADGESAVRRYSANFARRVYRNVSRHVAAMPAVAIPYVGAGVTAAMTGLDIREGCEALRDVNEMNRALGLAPENPAQVCALQVASREEIINRMMANWRTAYAVAAAWSNQYEVWLSPEPVPVDPARAIQVWGAVFGTLPNPSVPAGGATLRGPAPPISPLPPLEPVLPAYPGR